MSQLGSRSDLAPTDVTIVKDTIHNPADARHYMKLKPIARRVRMWREGVLLAETTDALQVLEAGYDMHNPAFYVPRDAINANLAPSEKSTHCPLKGDASYFNLLDDAGNLIQGNIAWSYTSPFDFASDLQERVSFFTDNITVEESPL